MRTLVLLRGAPGCGKTTWIRDHGLSNYVVSSDEIRKLYASPQLHPDGSIGISQKEDNVVWKTLFEILEHRMQNGDFTIIDACNSKTSEMTRYRDLAHNYRYRIYCVDMTSIPIEEAKRRNKLRDELKWVPDDYIDRVYSRFETQQIPSGIVRVLPDEFEDIVYMKPFDMSQYKQIVHIGDIHGCYDKLMEALPNGIEDDTGYIFIGDYCDRGPDSAKVIQYLLSIYKKPNVCLLEGNHERHLWEWANDRVSRSKMFEYNTRPQLERAGIDKKDVRELYRRMRQCSWYTFHGAEYLCTHAGISDFKMIGRLDLVSTREMIYGVGRYEDVEMCADSFESVGITQIFGHRNMNLKPTRMTEHSYCLEGGVERGGELRTVLLNDALQMIPHNYENPLPDLPIVEAVPSNDEVTIHDLVGKMRESKLIQEKRFGHISSFNFTRQAFADKKWNELTMKARGLFIDTVNNKIVARGYDKFFAVGEREETKLTSLEHRIAFPVDIYIKSNGFLGMASFDHATGQLFTTTKSTPDGDYADLFRSKIPDWQKQRMEDYLREHDVTLLFEVIDPVNDPHIITYGKDDIILLDVVTNTLDPVYLPYDELVAVSVALQCSVKGKYIPSKVETLDGLKAVIHDVEAIDSDTIEGIVLRDANGFMLKQKTHFYNQWKKLRGVAHSTLREGYLRHTQILATPLENYFYAFVKTLYKREGIKTDIISLRNMFYDEYPLFKEDFSDDSE